MLCDNIIATQTHHNVITGGETNSINPGAVRSFIGGGICNTVSAACAVIAGGCNNTVSGGFSAILGGNGNNDGGNALTGIYGIGINATPIPSGTGALWANELVVPNIPIGTLLGGIPTPPALYPAGSLWYYPDANGNNVVYVV